MHPQNGLTLWTTVIIVRTLTYKRANPCRNVWPIKVHSVHTERKKICKYSSLDLPSIDGPLINWPGLSHEVCACPYVVCVLVILVGLHCLRANTDTMKPEEEESLPIEVRINLEQDQQLDVRTRGDSEPRRTYITGSARTAVPIDFGHRLQWRHKRKETAAEGKLGPEQCKASHTLRPSAHSSARSNKSILSIFLTPRHQISLGALSLPFLLHLSSSLCSSANPSF